MEKFICTHTHRILLYVLIIFLFAAPSWLFAAQAPSGILPDIRVLNVENGLSSNQTNGVIVDRQGFLWVYTVNGLNRYDGYKFNTFTSSEDPNSIGGNNIQTGAIDSKDRIWTGGITLNCYDPHIKRFSRFPLTGNKAIKSIVIGKDGSLWFGGDEFGLIRFDTQTGNVLATYLHDEKVPGSLVDNKIRDIDESSDGNLWIATEQGIIEEFDPVKKVFYHHNPGEYLPPVKGLSVRCIEVDQKDRVWASTSKGLILYRPVEKTWKLYTHDDKNPNALPTSDIWSVYEDRNDGTIWIGTDKEGLSMFLPDLDGFLNFKSNETLHEIPPGAIFNITQDSEGALWLSVYNYGVCRFSIKNRKFRHYLMGPEPFGLSFNNLLDLYEDKKGKVWIATDGGGLDRFDPEDRTFKHYMHKADDKNSISTNSVLSIAEGREGILWFGTWEGGLNKLDTATDQFTHYSANPSKPGSLPGNSIFCISADNLNCLWLSVWDKGLYRFDPRSEIVTDFHSPGAGAPFSIKNRYINFIRKTEDGLLFVGGHGNLEIVHTDNTVEEISLTKSNEYFDMYRAKDGTLWFATSEGLVEYHLSDKTRTAYTKANGLPDDFIVSIKTDNTGMLWLGTHKGLCKFNPNTKKIVKYDVIDGLQSLEFNRYSSLKTRNGELYFAGTNGMNVFNPKDLKDSRIVPNILLTNLELYQKKATIGEKKSFLKEDISYLKELCLPYAHRDFSFEMIMMDFKAPEKNQYRYKLEGYDQDWKEVSAAQRHVRYTNLKPGKYRFLYQGFKPDGRTCTQEKSLDILILKPWWMESPAIAGFGILICLVVYLIIRIRLRFIMLRQRELEKQVEEKSYQLKKALYELEQTNSTLEKQVIERTKELTEEISERKGIQKRLLNMVTHDSLTGLTNRAWLTEKLDELMERVHSQEDFGFLMILIDGDQFKMINDSYGHVTGDKLLVAVSQRLKKNIPPSASISRHGGDEFIILVENVFSMEKSRQLAEKIQESFTLPFLIEYKSISFGFSMGVVISSQNHINGEDMLRDADIALYRAKAEGSRTYKFFDAEMKEKVEEEIRIIANLKKALEKDEFMLYYQPLIRISDGRLGGFEALIRCKNQNVGPDKFIPIAEESGLINEIGLWTIKEACSKIQKWSDRYPVRENNIVMSINLSPKQLLMSELIDNVEAILKTYSTDSALIKFEITETALMDNPVEAEKTLNRLVQRGIHLAIDDFGTGYSSLSYLYKLPFEFLKIDRSFVSGMEIDKQAYEIVKSTANLAKSLKMRTIAEGVETQSQLNILKSFGCEFAQGYLFDKPLPPKEMEETWLAALTADSHQI